MRAMNIAEPNQAPGANIPRAAPDIEPKVAIYSSSGVCHWVSHIVLMGCPSICFRFLVPTASQPMATESGAS